MLLHEADLPAGGTMDSGWQDYRQDITAFLGGAKRVRLVLGLRDAWAANWQQTASFDDVSLSIESSCERIKTEDCAGVCGGSAGCRLRECVAAEVP